MKPKRKQSEAKANPARLQEGSKSKKVEIPGSPIASSELRGESLDPEMSEAHQTEKEMQESSTQVPPILFQDDALRTPGPAGPVQKFELGASPPAATPVLDQLPEAYGTGRLMLMKRDSHCLYAHWDLTYDQMQRYNTRARDHHLALRLCLEGQSLPLSEAHIHPDSRHWFIHVDRVEGNVRVELGYYEPSQEWRTVSISELISLSPKLRTAEKLADVATHGFGTSASLPEGSRTGSEVSTRPFLPAHVPVGSAPPPPFVARPPLPQADLPHCPSYPYATASEGSLSEKGIAGQEVAGRPTPPTHTKSVEVKVPKELFGCPPFEVEAPLSISSQMGAVPPEQKAFWLGLNVEVIIYGATAPDALLLMHDQPIPTRPDGTFSYRLALPDGQYTLPIIAVSQQGDTRGAVLSFSRVTQHQGEVHSHPLDPNPA